MKAKRDAAKLGGPTIRRGEANQNASTPWPFIRAVEEKFGPLTIDLAASDTNAKAGRWITEEQNALVQDWAALTHDGLGWNNCPFANITPWARYHAQQVQLGSRTLLLVPASVGANWYWDWVVPYADVYSIGRLVFDDCFDRHGELITTPYPKDLILCHYDRSQPRFSTGSRNENLSELIRWRWDV
jgi:phage N-6-adenine-methyltransferase